MTSRTPISVWFFTGALLAFYGVVIFTYGLFALEKPLPDRALAELHPDIWWGAFMLVVGAFYTIKFYPREKK
jgi:hypothetical protein